MDLHYRQELQVGFLVLAALAILAIGLVWLSGRSIAGTSSFDVRFANIQGVSPGDPVQISGVRVGRVADLQLRGVGEVVLVLDRCTDGTLEIARRHAEADPRITIVENDSCPEGWAGKCHAAAVGARRATGAYLLFTDADTVFDPDLVRASVALAHARDLGLLSLLSTLTFTRRDEQIVQPVASMILVGLYPIDRVNRDDTPRPFANGQFMLFRRSTYDRLGGHAAVRDSVLEDLAFASAVSIAIDVASITEAIPVAILLVGVRSVGAVVGAGAARIVYQAFVVAHTVAI